MATTPSHIEQIVCINKPNRYSSEEAIINVGGFTWTSPMPGVALRVMSGMLGLYTMVNGRQAPVQARVSSAGNPYLQTRPDGTWTNNLLSLPECQ
ncbi:MAG: DUF3892 domain-containing protein [Chloroflexota bacterium]|nr:DUF3892 domain-containing protein [Chloroflexota bacterium]